MSKITVDFEKAQRAVEDLKRNPPSEDEVKRDLKAFLAKHGVDIDDDMHNLIKSRLSGAAATQALVLHVDAG